VTGRRPPASDDGSRQITIRRATANDLDAVVALRIALLREYREHPIYGRLRADAERRARPIFAAQIESDREAIFLAEDSSSRESIGMLRCVESIASPLLVPDRYCYVSSVYVKPAHRRRGILRQLFERAREWCRERGLPEMRLHNVGSRSMSAAVWDAFGFEVVEQVRLLRLDPGDQARVRTSSTVDAPDASDAPAPRS
jgi:ribosomal protein S18 acetylase RimI-like enzyme